jgi:outer membrane lipoprotein-sorting protein
VITPWILLGFSQQPIPFDQLEGRILRSYRAINTLEQTIRGQSYGVNVTMHVYFKRPGKFAVFGTSGERPKLSLVCDGHKIYDLEGGKWNRMQGDLEWNLNNHGGYCDVLAFLPTLLLYGTLQNDTIPDSRDLVNVRTVADGTLKVTNWRTNFGDSLTLWLDRKSYLVTKVDDTLLTASQPPENHVEIHFGALRINQGVPDRLFRPRLPRGKTLTL